MVQPCFTFNIFDSGQRQQVRAMLDALDSSPSGTTQKLMPSVQATEDAVIQKLPLLLRLGSGELLRLAVLNFGPDETFDIKELAEKSGADFETILSRNRTLAHSCEKRGIQKSALLAEHGGSPRKFSVPASVHANVLRLLSE